MFKFYINNIEVNDMPDGWDDITSTVKRDEFTGALIYDADLKFTSYGGQDLYDALKVSWNSDRFGKSKFDIYQRSGTSGYVLIHAGSIFHTDLKWKLVNNSVEFRVEDSSYWSKINNNKKIETAIDISESKNGVLITPAAKFDIELHDVNTGSFYPDTRKAYRLFDAIKFLIDYISDGTIGFESECFDVGGIYSDYCLISGEEMIYHNDNLAPKTSFEKLLEEVRKRFNVRMAITGTQAAPIVKLEPSNYWYSSADSYTIPSVPDEVNMQVNESKLLGTVRVGSTKYETTATLHYPDIPSLIAYREETFYFSGTNNVDNSLDLIGNYVVSNASIEVVLDQYSGYEDYEKEVFLIQYDTATDKSKITGSYLYNYDLNNANVLQRHADVFPNNVLTNNTNASGDRFLAIHTSAADPVQEVIAVNTVPITKGPIQFDDDYSNGYDPNQNYGGGISQGNPVTQFDSYYTAPSSGNYAFASTITFEVLAYLTPSSSSPVIVSAGSVIASIQYQVYSGGSLIAAVDSGFVLVNNIGTYTVTGSYLPLLNAGETVEVYLKFVNNTIPDPIDLQFGYTIIADVTTYSSTGGTDNTGIIVSSNTNAFKCIKIDFKYPLLLSDYQSIRESKSGIIKVPLQGTRSISGWIDNIKYDHNSGETQFSLITDGNTIYR